MSQDSDRLRRFEQEAQAAAALNHPNILAVYHFGSYEGAPYLVSELLQGDTLRQVLSHSPIPVRKAIEYGVQIAHGLAAAHEKGIVHRDLKPENLFVTKDGRVKSLDFGLAKLTQRQPDSDGVAPTISEGTEPGVVMGTVGYMSPEQVRGKTVDHHADIFAFGAILYEMLTGNRAFHRSTSAETMTAILNDEPPGISQVVQSTPPGLQRVVHRCLEKNPEQRFQSASDLAFALEALSESGSAPAVAVEKGKRRRWLWAGAALLVIAALSIGWYVRRNSLAKETGAGSPALEVKVLTGSGRARAAAITPDGRYVGYVNRDHGKDELRLLQVATERDVQLFPGSPLQIRALHFSPDGNFIYFLRQLRREDEDERLGLYRIATLGGPAPLLATDASGYSVTVSPDGKQVAYVTYTQSESLIVAVDPDGSNRRILARRPLGRPFVSIEWSPFTERMAAAAVGENEGLGLVSVELPSGSVRNLSVTGWGEVGKPAWAPDGATIFAPAVVSGSSIMQIWAFDANSGAHRPLTASFTSYSMGNLSATATGDMIASTITSDATLWVVDHPGQPHPIPSIKGEGAAGVVWVDARIVTSNFLDVMLHETDGSQPTKLRSFSNINRDSEMTRCGPGKVAYWANDPKRKSHIARTDIATGVMSALTDGPDDSEPTCTADGSILVFIHCGQVRCSLARKSLETGQSDILYEFGPNANSNSGFPMISPSGKDVLFWLIDDKNPYDWAMIMPLRAETPGNRRCHFLTVKSIGLLGLPMANRSFVYDTMKMVSTTSGRCHWMVRPRENSQILSPTRSSTLTSPPTIASSSPVAKM